jgi:hypothetical protein
VVVRRGVGAKIDTTRLRDRDSDNVTKGVEGEKWRVRGNGNGTKALN